MNKVIRTVDEIEQKIQKECGVLAMDHEPDRATMAWWIYNTFVKKQFTGGPMERVTVTLTGGQREGNGGGGSEGVLEA